jgi:hypothetical protein
MSLLLTCRLLLKLVSLLTLSLLTSFVVFAVADAFVIWLPQSGSKASSGTPLDVD